MKTFVTISLSCVVGLVGLYVLYVAAWHDLAPESVVIYPELELVTEQGLQPTVLGASSVTQAD